MIMDCEHKHVVRMANYYLDDTVKSWLHCTDCDSEVKL